MMSKYSEIIKRLESAKGGDPELSARIWAAFAGVRYIGHCKPYGDDTGRVQVEYTEPPKRTRQVTNPPRMPHAEPVTSSIDAAIALVERMLPGHCLALNFDNRKRAYVYKNDGYNIATKFGEWVAYADAETMPLAILLSLLRALEAKEALS